MLSYQHGYHAGSFADVIKHVALTRLLKYMTLKDKPLFYLETHAGKGLYDLHDKQAIKTGEYKEGIGRIWEDRRQLPPVFHEYIQLIEQLNQTNELKFYPGSPYLAIEQLRSMDRAYLCELHPKEFDCLAAMPHRGKRIHVAHLEGLSSLKSQLPPAEKRGLVFLDPSFELKEEYKLVPQAIMQAYHRFSNGMFCLWYPLVNSRFTAQLHRGMNAIGAKNTVYIEFNLTLAPQDGMTGCGLWLINPSFTFAEEMKSALDVLKTYFSPKTCSYQISN